MSLNSISRPLRQWFRSLHPRRFLLAVVVLCSLGLGWGLAQVAHAQIASPAAQPAAMPVPVNPTDTVDRVAPNYRLGQQFYLEHCATCHVGLPPAVMPSQTWADLLPDAQHYGVTLQPLVQPTLEIVWKYASTYSRPISKDERTPYRLAQSRYFKALHPKVEFTGAIGVGSCAACHPAAAQFNYRSLTADWQNAP
jgi:Dihaem cytochrome c